MQEFAVPPSAGHDEINALKRIFLKQNQFFFKSYN